MSPPRPVPGPAGRASAANHMTTFKRGRRWLGRSAPRLYPPTRSGTRVGQGQAPAPAGRHLPDDLAGRRRRPGRLPGTRLAVIGPATAGSAPVPAASRGASVPLGDDLFQDHRRLGERLPPAGTRPEPGAGTGAGAGGRSQAGTGAVDNSGRVSAGRGIVTERDRASAWCDEEGCGHGRDERGDARPSGEGRTGRVVAAAAEAPQGWPPCPAERHRDGHAHPRPRRARPHARRRRAPVAPTAMPADEPAHEAP